MLPILPSSVVMLIGNPDLESFMAAVVAAATIAAAKVAKANEAML